jgi:hypothetical protein
VSLEFGAVSMRFSEPAAIFARMCDCSVCRKLLLDHAYELVRLLWVLESRCLLGLNTD